MENESSKLLPAELTEKTIGVDYDVFNELGHGFLETENKKIREHQRESAVRGFLEP